jgi:uncharacterized protein YrrD
MDIPINAKVYCQDKFCGHAKAVILNPINDVVTHVVVKESKNSHAERLVPIDMIDAILADNIHLKLNTTMLQNLPSLYDVEYIQTTVSHFIETTDLAFMEPVIVPEKKILTEKNYHIPSNELPVKRGTHVFSADGYDIGTVNEFLVNQNGGNITHLVLREGHIFGKKDVFIPVKEIKTINESEIHLVLDKKNIERLPAIPAQHLFS